MLNKSRRNFLKTSALAGVGLMFINPKSYGREKMENNNSLKGKKVLYIYGGWEGHEPKQSAEVFVPWLKSEGAEVAVSDNLDSYLDEELMGSVDLIIQAWTMGTITNEQERGLLKAIRNGAGLTGWHGGIGDSFRNNTEYQFMVGGQWVAHPGGVIDYSVQITDKNDSVTKGMNDFKIHSEQYYMHIDPNVKVLATTEFTAEHTSWIDKCVIPVVWKKYYGNGRIFYSSLGHVMSDFEVPEVREIMERGIRWAAESKFAPKEKWVSPVYK